MKLFTSTLKHALIALVLLLLDFVLLSGAMVGAYSWRLHSEWRFAPKLDRLDIPSYWFAYGLTIYFVLSMMVALGLYRLDRFRSWREDVQTIVKAVTFSALLLLALSFFYRNIQYSRQIVLMAWPMAIAALSAGRLIHRGFLFWLRSHGRLLRRVLVVGEGPMFPFIVQKLNEQPGAGLRAVGFISHVDRPRDLAMRLLAEKIDVVFLADEKFEHERVLELIEICEEHDVELLLVPQVYDLLIGFSGLRDLQGLPLVELREEPVRWSSLALKRGFDFTVGAALLLLTLPLQIILAVAICLDSKGPALFFQERVGYRGKVFQMWKFRSMVVDAESRLSEVVDLNAMEEPVFKVKNDPRITRLGKWLRRTSLDELPQLVNVVFGQMSLVGPRPEEVEMVKRYNVWQRRRLKVKPGLTGLQQIKCRGSSSLAERVRYDILYIRRLSLLLDLEILFKTIWVVASQKGAH